MHLTMMSEDLDGVDDAAGHDRELPGDAAHPHFQLRHVGSAWQHVGQAVRAGCDRKKPKHTTRMITARTSSQTRPRHSPACFF